MPLSWRPILLLLVSICVLTSAADLFSNSFLVRFRRDVEQQEAHTVAKRNGFVNLGPVLGSKKEYHFVSHAIPAARAKRSIPHVRKLKVDPL
ncbi:neuroendocrine convertase 2-like, partial [Anoplophora glabripennis]|uniref:neuroendocrine convertase 2-like n=1 Tax=Anoplophora glabripennis TaxID=217634 RepID=UPI000C78E13B